MRKVWCTYVFHAIRKGHTTHNYFLILPHKNKRNFEKIDDMLAASNCVERKKEDRNPLDLALIAKVKESSTMMDVDEIISSQISLTCAH
jgi:hypothetical protein